MNARDAQAFEFVDDHQSSCLNYLKARTGCYAYRAVRYNAAAQRMLQFGLDDESLVVDVGAGWTELDYCLRTQFNWRGRYLPVDGNLDGTDLNDWYPRQADFFVCLEVLEHLDNPWVLLARAASQARRGIIVSVPNPRTTDVLGMDPTHKTVIERGALEMSGFHVEERSFYGQPADSLFAWWAK